MPGLLILVFFEKGGINISWHVCSASSSFKLWSAILPGLSSFFPLCSILTSVWKKLLVIPELCQAGFLSPPLLLLYFYYHGGFHKRTSAIWRWKGWNHPDSCPATEPLKLPDKAVRLHFRSNCQSKLALPFTINKRRRAVPFQPVSEPSNCSPFWEALKCIFSPLLSLYAVRLSAYISCSVLLLSFRLCCVSCCIYSGGNTAECS